MRKKTYNENYFENIDSEDKAYFLGLIAADGCIINNKKKYRYMLCLKLHKKDIHILKSFKESIGSEKKIWCSKKRDMCEVTISGKKMINDLIKLGLDSNKTFVLKYPEIEEKLEKHFLRGYVDGDGCIRINTDKRDNSKRGDLRIVSGSIDILNKINERMNVLFNTNINKLYGPKNANYKYIGWAGMTDIEKIYYGLYEGSNLFLYRKKIIFDEVMKTIKNKQKYRKK